MASSKLRARWAAQKLPVGEQLKKEQVLKQLAKRLSQRQASKPSSKQG